MPITSSLLAYDDCMRFYTAAARDPKGVRLKLETLQQATYLRMRMHQCRTIIRKDNAKTYPSDHYLHGRSEWDRFVLSIVKADGVVYIYVKPIDSMNVVIESLSNGHEIDAPTVDPVPVEENHEEGEDLSEVPDVELDTSTGVDVDINGSADDTPDPIRDDPPLANIKRRV